MAHTRHKAATQKGTRSEKASRVEVPERLKELSEVGVVLKAPDVLTFKHSSNIPRGCDRGAYSLLTWKGGGRNLGSRADSVPTSKENVQ